jgi:predicted GIY-YIG superfamily endonuclease
MSYRKKSSGYSKKSSGYSKKSSGYSKKSSGSSKKSSGYSKKSNSYNKNSDKTTYVYSLNLKDGKKYVGMTSNPEKRIGQHFLGNGAKWTQKNKPVSVNHIQKCKSLSNAKKAETIVYKKMRDYHGINKVRGAGHTKSY